MISMKKNSSRVRMGREVQSCGGVLGWRGFQSLGYIYIFIYRLEWKRLGFRLIDGEVGMGPQRRREWLAGCDV